MPNAPLSDATVAQILASVPEFQQWKDHTLAPDARSLLKTADRQQLMAITAHALRLIVNDQGA